MKKEKHIQSYDELAHYLAMTGHIFPRTEMELKNAVKLHSDIDYEALANEVVAEDIWEAENPRSYKVIEASFEDTQDEAVSSAWAMAARGNSKLSKETLDKIRKNQENKKGDDSPD